MEEQFEKLYNMEFIDRSADEKPEMSVNDKHFMNIVETSVKLDEGHYMIDLPLVNPDVELPDNYQ